MKLKRKSNNWKLLNGSCLTSVVMIVLEFPIQRCCRFTFRGQLSNMFNAHTQAYSRDSGALKKAWNSDLQFPRLIGQKLTTLINLSLASLSPKVRDSSGKNSNLFDPICLHSALHPFLLFTIINSSTPVSWSRPTSKSNSRHSSFAPSSNSTRCLKATRCPRLRHHTI